MLIYVKKKKNFLRTDRRTTQNYSSEPHKKEKKFPFQKKKKKSLKKKKQTIYSYALACFTKFPLQYHSS
jgi:hypothetical protein